MRYLLVPVIPIFIGMIGLVAFLQWYTATAFIVAFGIFAYKGHRYYQKHHASEKYDSKLTDKQIEIARDRWIKGVKERED